MQIKLQLGKLTLHEPIEQIVEREQTRNGMLVLPIQFSHVLEIRRLPVFHRDPFDRMLIAQARVENLPVLTVDPVFQGYPVATLS